MFGRREQRDFEEEIRAHLELETERLRAQGLSPRDAERAARRTFGNVGVAQDRFHDAQPLRWLHDFVKDLRHATRTLVRAPAYSIAVVLTLAVGIGANSAMFTIVNAVLLRPLPYPESERIVSLSVTDEGKDEAVLPDRAFRLLAAGGAPSLEAVAASDGRDMTVVTPGGPAKIQGSSTTSRYFSVFGLRPMRGRLFTDDEDRPGAPAVVVISEQMWRGVFASDSAILGKSVLIENKPTTVIGIMPAAATTARRAQFWMPLRIAPPVPGAVRFYYVVGRMRRSATIDVVRAEVATVVQRTQEAQPRDPTKRGRPETSIVMTLHERRFGDSRRTLVLLFSMVGVLLTIACANLANLSLARAARREREFALRLTLGAGRGRIIRSVISECLVLSVAGATLGALLAAASVGYFVRVSPGAIAGVEGVRVDATALAFTLTVAVSTAFIFGVVPALRAARGDVNLAMTSGTPRATTGRHEQLFQRTLIVAQLATALVMLTGAAIVTKTLARVSAIDVGFDARNLTIVSPSLGRGRYTAATAEVFYQQLMTRLQRDPQVRAVTLVNPVPLGGIRARVSAVDSTGKLVSTDLVNIDAHYFATIGARIVAGRDFTDADRQGTPSVVIINETMAREQFAGRSPLGATINQDGKRTIVGVVRDIRQRALEEPVQAVAYFPVAQEGVDQFHSVIVRTADNASGLSDRIRAMVREIDAGQVPPAITTMEERMSDAVAPRRFTVVLLGIFAGLAAALAVVGLYGMLSYLVAARTREIGIRVALGADSRRVLWSVLQSGMLLTTIGTVLGAAIASLAVRLLESLVYDMTVYDPWMFSASAVMLVSVALIASYLPARRAASIDPVGALRAE